VRELVSFPVVQDGLFCQPFPEIRLAYQTITHNNIDLPQHETKMQEISSDIKRRISKQMDI